MLRLEYIRFDRNLSQNWVMRSAALQHHIIFLLIRGTVTYHIDGQAITVRKGQGMYLAQGTVREAYGDPHDPPLMYSIHFVDPPHDYITGFAGESYTLFHPSHFDYLKQRFTTLYESWVGKLPCYQLVTSAITMEIIALIQQDLLSDGLHDSIARKHASYIRDFIVRHYRESIRLQQLADLIERTPNYVSSIFKEFTGKTPIQFMHELRIAAAQELLAGSQMTIGEISDHLGYCDQTYFNYMYKKIVGHPPSKMRYANW